MSTEPAPPMPPGSFVAKRHGCTCDMTRNQYGKGAFISGGGAVQYETAPTCPLHGPVAA